MSAQATELPHSLFVTGPDRDRLYEHFTRLFMGRSDVRVLKDRRLAERRGAPAPVTTERRRADRRRQPPGWIVPPS